MPDSNVVPDIGTHQERSLRPVYYGLEADRRSDIRSIGRNKVEINAIIQRASEDIASLLGFQVCSIVMFYLFYV